MTGIGPAVERVQDIPHRSREGPPEFSDGLPSLFERIGISTPHLNTDFPSFDGGADLNDLAPESGGPFLKNGRNPLRASHRLPDNVCQTRNSCTGSRDRSDGSRRRGDAGRSRFARHLAPAPCEDDSPSPSPPPFAKTHRAPRPSTENPTKWGRR